MTSHASDLAIRVAVHLALQPPGKLSPIRQVAAGAGLPAAYLAKIMHLLVRAGLVRALRGPGGGVELSRPPDSISLSDLVRAVEGKPAAECCIMSSELCSASQPCLLHSLWGPLRAEILRLLDETSLDMLLPAAQGKRSAIREAVPVPGQASPRRKSKPRARKGRR